MGSDPRKFSATGKTSTSGIAAAALTIMAVLFFGNILYGVFGTVIAEFLRSFGR